MKCKHSMRLASVLIASTVSLAFSGPLFGAPKDVYVTTTGAGDMDGRDWENAMFNITEAYALCAANADGGTVHVVGGVYRSTGWDATLGNFTEGAAVVPASNVTLRGSDDRDNPTILTGDRNLDNTWEEGSVKQWQNGKLVEPGETVITRPVAKGTVNESALFSSSASIENCRFEHLTIHGFIGTAVALNNVTNAVFDSCRFIGMGTWNAHDSATGLSLKDTSATLTNCSVVTCRNGISATAAADTSVKILGCLFRASSMSGAYGFNASLRLQNYVRADIRDTTFKYNKSAVTCAISGSTLKLPVTMSDTVFRNCTCNADGSGSTICNLNAGGTLDGCLFVSNTVKVTRGNYSDSAAIVSDQGDFLIRNSYFGYSKLTKVNASQSDAAVLAVTYAHSHCFINCTVESNRVEGSINPCSFGGWQAQSFAVANCVFRNNELVTPDGERKSDFRNIRLTDATTWPPMFVNTIVWNDAEDYVPFTYKAGDDVNQRMGVASCVIRNYTPPASAKTTGFFYQPILSVDPQFSAVTRSVGTRRARPLTAATHSGVRLRAVKVCKATNGDFYFLDTHKSPNEWRKIAVTSAAVLSLEQGEAIGLTPDMAAYPDVFGNARRARASMGPVDAPPLGLVIGIR